MAEEKRALAIEDCDGNRSWVKAWPEIPRSHPIGQFNQRQRVIAIRSGRGLCVRRMQSRDGEQQCAC
jgi:hypothetical protein